MASVAYDPALQEKADKDEQEAGQAQAGQPITTSTAEAGGGQQVGSSTTGQTSAPAAPPTRSSIGKFSNLGDYLKVNAGAGAQIADKIIGDETQKIQQATETVTGESQKLAGQAAGSRAYGYNPNKTASQYDQDVAKSILEGTYAGPTTYSNTGAADLFRTGEAKGAAGQTLEGQQQLLRENLAPQDLNTYTKGEQTLDAVLLGRDQEAANRFKALKELAAAGGQAYQTGQTNVESAAKAAQDYNAEQKKLLQDQLINQGSSLAQSIRMDELNRQQAAKDKIEQAARALKLINFNRLYGGGQNQDLANTTGAADIQALEQMLGGKISGLSDLGIQRGGGQVSDAYGKREVSGFSDEASLANALRADLLAKNPLYGAGVTEAQSKEVTALKNLLGSGLPEGLANIDPSRLGTYNAANDEQVLLDTLRQYFNFDQPSQPTAQTVTPGGGPGRTGGSGSSGKYRRN